MKKATLMRKLSNGRILTFNRTGESVTRCSLLHRSMLLAILSLTLASTAQAQRLTFSFTDPIGDQTGTIDITGMTLNFDNATGNYDIVLTTTETNPFVGLFRINVNLFNPDTTATNSFFTDNVNDFNLAVATTTIVLTGTSSKLLAWNAGDRVATNTLPFGNPSPPISFFRSSVLNIPLGTGEDAIAFGAEGFTTISPATPQPAVALLLDDVADLLDGGILTQDQADGLIDKLEAVIAKLNKGNTSAACNQLQAFINQVNAFINAGMLSLEEGQDLIDAAEDVREQIGC